MDRGMGSQALLFQLVQTLMHPHRRQILKELGQEHSFSLLLLAVQMTLVQDIVINERDERMNREKVFLICK